jgi:hypothetical protein
MNTPAARLEVVAGRAVGTSIVVEDEIVIGRHADGPGRLADDEEISRAHARVTLDPSGACEIEDLGSTNGTYVNGLRISGPEELSVGDTIEIGQTTLAVRELPASRPSSPDRDKLFFPEEEEPELEEPPRPPAPVAAEAPPAERPEPQVFDQEEPEPEPVATEAQVLPPAPEAPPNLSLQLEVDFENHEARIVMDNASEPVRLVFEAGAWRVAPSASSEEGDAP